ncbi:hypothetical protein C1Y40_03569 [Mycobacterium talmoniae]|uniref:Uncharacterized protein n=1 Tax=Mycobacterium talmoniae TaxID=1858794 RepID=A0A2S8BHV4_9MYCO|nr:hypothetical protein C1Y40_03569 [Mycobacterium talmoniae]
MHRTWSGTLTDQEGRTADAGRDAFQAGERLSRETAEKYETIRRSNKSAHDSASELRSALLTIAENGNSRIEEIQQSKDSLPIKVGKITEVVADCQTQANAKAAACAGNMLTDIQHVLDKHGIQVSAQQFASDNGFDTTRMFRSPNTAKIRQQVETTLNAFGPPEGTQALGNPIPPPDAPAPSAGNPRSTFVGDTPDLTTSVGAAAAQPQDAPTYAGQAPKLPPTGTSSATPTYVGQAPALSPSSGSAPAPTGSPTPAPPNAGPAPVSRPVYRLHPHHPCPRPVFQPLACHHPPPHPPRRRRI